MQLWAKKIDIVFYQVWFWEKVDNLQKFRSRRNKMFVGILIFLVFSESDIQYLCEISVCKVLVTIKVVPVKNDYFFYPKFELHRYQQMNKFLYWCSFYRKKVGAYISHELIGRLIPNLNLIRSTYSKSNLAIESPAILSLFFSVQSTSTTWKHLAVECYFDVIVSTLNA